MGGGGGAKAKALTKLSGKDDATHGYVSRSVRPWTGMRTRSSLLQGWRGKIVAGSYPAVPGSSSSLLAVGL